MSKEVIRKANSYQVQTISLHEEFRTSFIVFNNLINDLAIQLKRIIRSLSFHSDKQGHTLKISLEKGASMMESIVYKISNTTLKIDEIIQNIGGLEFSTSEIISQFTNMLKNIDEQHNIVFRLYSKINYNIQNQIYSKELGLDYNQDFIELELEFSILQEEIQNSIPKINLLFDEFNTALVNSIKYGSTNHF